MIPNLMAPRPVYGWVNGSRMLNTINVQRVGERLAEITGPAGITPDLVVEEASDPASVLHPLFEWNDETAGDLYRQNQARTLLRSVRVLTVERPPQLAYVSVMVDGQKRSYVPFEVMATSPSYREFAILEALRFLRGFQERFRQLEELRPVLDAIQQVTDTLLTPPPEEEMP